MFAGGVAGAMAGCWRDAVLALLAWPYAGGIKFRLTPNNLARERFFAIFVNGVWMGNFWAPVSGDVEGVLPVDTSLSRLSIYAVEVGQWESFGDYIPSKMIEYLEARAAERLRFNWTGSYAKTAITGDSQVTVSAIRGAKRGKNVAAVADFPQRGRLTYSITTDAASGKYYLRWYAGPTLVAEGSRSGNGAFTCSAKNDSDLELDAAIVYTADLPAGTAFIDLMWTAEFEVHHAKASTNLHLHSEELNLWFQLNMPVTANQADAPDGTHTADLVSAAMGSTFLYYGPGATGLTAGAWTGSIYLKGTVGQKVYFVLESSNPLQYSVQEVTFTGAWQRVEAPLTVVDGLMYVVLTTYPGTFIGADPNPQLPAVNFYAWGGQVNAGSTATEYVKTTTVAATGGLFFPVLASGLVRTPQAIVLDQGVDDYTYLTVSQSSGSVHYNVLQRDDEGLLQTTIAAPGDSPLTVNAAPIAPTITGISVVAGAAKVSWTVGEAGCTFTAYFSKVNFPVNFGNVSTPAPVTTALNATNATSGTALGSTATTDYTSDYATVSGAFDAAIAALAVQLLIDEAAFLVEWDSFQTTALAALDTYATALGKPLRGLKNELSAVIEVTQKAADVSAGDADFVAVMNTPFANLCTALSGIVDGTAGRYALISGIVPDGTSAPGHDSLLSAALPFVKPATVRAAVRATKSGIQELNDNIYTQELDGAGAIVAVRPNAAHIQAITFAGLVATVTVGVSEAGAAAAATQVVILIDDAEFATEDLPATTDGYHEVEVTVDLSGSGAGWYTIGARAIAANGKRSAGYASQRLYADGAAPSGVTSVSGQVIRG